MLEVTRRLVQIARLINRGERGETYSLLRKKPPNSMNGMTIGGPMVRAVAMLSDMHEMKYPVRRKND